MDHKREAPSEHAAAKAKKLKIEPVFVDNAALSAYGEEHLVKVDGVWQVLLEHIAEPRLAMIRAPPKSGKTLLGMLAQDRVKAVKDSKFQVRFCPFLDDIDDFVGEQGFNNVREMAQDSGEKKIIYYFDETHDIPDAVNEYFIKHRLGYAVFASSGIAKQAASYITPVELQKNLFHYSSPANRDQVCEWLVQRLGVLLGSDVGGREVGLAAELLMAMTGGHIGILQFVGGILQERGCKSFVELRQTLQALLGEDVAQLNAARCFGVENGAPQDEQMLLISMLRCTGALVTTDVSGAACDALDLRNPLHRQGLSQAYYAPTADMSAPIVKITKTNAIGFSHGLQPELYKLQFDSASEWRKRSHVERWLVDFNRDDNAEVASTPTNVVDLVASWLSHVRTSMLLRGYRNVDAEERQFQDSFYEFHTSVLRMSGDREFPVAHCGDVKGFLDHIVGKMGVEFLIRSSADNKFDVSGFVGLAATKKYLKEHAGRAEGKYAETAKRCTEGYVTVLIGSLTNTTANQEWDGFEQFIAELSDEQAEGGRTGTNFPIMMAVAPFGWAKWDVFLWDPALKKCVRFEIKRQCLMYKIVDGKPVIARHFYPRPTEVWARELVVEGGGALKLTGQAFEVKPEEDNVASLAEGIVAKNKSLRCDARELNIYSLSRTGVWRELEKPSQVLYENTDEKPYGFLVPRGAA